MANHDCNVALVEGPLPESAALAPVGAGALVEFRGNVRPLENGEPIRGIDYDAHRAMAEHQLQAIACEAARDFALLSVTIQHRVGFVAAGECSLLLRVASPHRGAAFRASEWIVEELKKRVPIWKQPQREHAPAATGKAAAAR